MLCYFANLKAIIYESTSLNRIVADKSHRVIIVAYNNQHLFRKDFDCLTCFQNPPIRDKYNLFKMLITSLSHLELF